MIERQTRHRLPPNWLAGLLLLSSIIFLGWCLQDYRHAAFAFQQARDDLAESRALSQQIAALDHRPFVASLDTSSSRELTRQIGDTLQQAAIPTKSLLSLVPSEPLRVGRTDYHERQTVMELGSVRLEMLASLHQALASRAGLYLDELVLTAVPQQEVNQPELWNARLTLTHITYSPKSQ